jgi:hypothetical protein
VIARVAAAGSDSLESTVTRALQDGLASLPDARDALQAKALHAEKSRVIATVELAGARLPLEVSTFAQANQDVQAGSEAMWVQMGQSQELVFPQRMVQTGDTPSAALVGAVARVSGDASLPMPGVAGHEVLSLRNAKGLEVWRMPVTQMTEITPGGDGVLLTRGVRLVASREITTAGLERFASDMLGHLTMRVATTPDGSELFATYWPLQDRADAVATPMQRAMLCAALVRSARGPSATQTRALAESLLLRLLKPSAQGEVDALGDATTAAATLMAIHELHRDGSAITPLREAAALRCRATLDRAFVQSAEGTWAWDEKVPVGARSVVTLAMALDASCTQCGDDAAREVAKNRAQSAARSLLADATPASLVTHMPWLGYALQELAGDGDISAAAGLREMRAMLWQRAVTAGAGEPEFVGGIVFGSRDAGAIPGPTWTTARPVAFAAAMLRDERLTDEAERWEQLSKLTASCRFLRQLALDDASAYACPQPERALWGVRVALWDHRQPIESTAMSLLAVQETLESIAWLAAQGKETRP